jgi:hypothetical protein
LVKFGPHDVILPTQRLRQNGCSLLSRKALLKRDLKY